MSFRVKVLALVRLLELAMRCFRVCESVSLMALMSVLSMVLLASSDALRLLLLVDGVGDELIFGRLLVLPIMDNFCFLID